MTNDTKLQATTQSSSPRIAEVMLLITTLIWGGTFGATKFLLDSGMLPLSLLTIRFGLAALIFFVLLSKRVEGRYDRSTLLNGIVLGLLLYGGFGLQTAGLGYTSSSRSGFITALYVVITPFLQIYFTRQAPAWNIWVSVAVVTFGLWYLTGTSSTEDFMGLNTGDLLTLGCAVIFAFYILALDRLAPKFNPIRLTSIQLFVSGICSATQMVFTESFTLPETPFQWSLLFYLALFATVFTTWCQVRFQPLTTPSRAAIIYTMESVFAAIIGVLILHEALGFEGYVGGLLIICGLLLVQFPPFAKRRRLKEERESQRSQQR